MAWPGGPAGGGAQSGLQNLLQIYIVLVELVVMVGCKYFLQAVTSVSGNFQPSPTTRQLFIIPAHKQFLYFLNETIKLYFATKLIKI